MQCVQLNLCPTKTTSYNFYVILIRKKEIILNSNPCHIHHSKHTLNRKYKYYVHVNIVEKRLRHPQLNEVLDKFYSIVKNILQNFQVSFSF